MRPRTVTELREAIAEVAHETERHLRNHVADSEEARLTEWELDSTVSSGLNEILRVLRVEEGLDTREGT